MAQNGMSCALHKGTAAKCLGGCGGLPRSAGALFSRSSGGSLNTALCSLARGVRNAGQTGGPSTHLSSDLTLTGPRSLQPTASQERYPCCSYGCSPRVTTRVDVATPSVRVRMVCQPSSRPADCSGIHKGARGVRQIKHVPGSPQRPPRLTCLSEAWTTTVVSHPCGLWGPETHLSLLPKWSRMCGLASPSHPTGAGAQPSFVRGGPDLRLHPRHQVGTPVAPERGDGGPRECLSELALRAGAVVVLCGPLGGRCVALGLTFGPQPQGEACPCLHERCL